MISSAGANAVPRRILVNNAGIIDVRPLIMSSFESFWRQIEVNFKGVRMLSYLRFSLLTHTSRFLQSTMSFHGCGSKAVAASSTSLREVGLLMCP